MRQNVSRSGCFHFFALVDWRLITLARPGAQVCGVVQQAAHWCPSTSSRLCVLQARALGLLGSSHWKGGSRGGPSNRRGALRGGRGGAALRRSLNVIDHRPRKVFVQGMDEGDKENLQAHFAVSSGPGGNGTEGSCCSVLLSLVLSLSRSLSLFNQVIQLSE